MFEEMNLEWDLKEYEKYMAGYNLPGRSEHLRW